MANRRLDHLRALHDFIGELIAEELGPSLPRGTDHPLVQAVSALYEVNPEHVLGGGRGHRVTRARHALAWLLHRDGMSHTEIAEALGYTDAATVRYALRQTASRHGVTALLLALPEVAAHPNTGGYEQRFDTDDDTHGVRE